MRHFFTISLLTLLAPALHARETAMLRNGFSISHDHHQKMGAITRLFLTSSDQEYVDVPTENIASFETEPDPAPATPPAVTPPPPATLDDVVAKAARENQLDSDFVRAVIRAESNGKANAVSRKGAQGLMQLMPQTAAKMGVKNSFDPDENVGAGTRYLRDLLARYHNDPVRALAAYNAGAGRVAQYRGVPPYKETRAYVSGIIRDFNRRKLEQARATKVTSKSAKASSSSANQVNHPPSSD
jgi:soluble lytic murein transglycosylase-like protein